MVPACGEETLPEKTKALKLKLPTYCVMIISTIYALRFNVFYVNALRKKMYENSYKNDYNTRFMALETRAYFEKPIVKCGYIFPQRLLPLNEY